MAESWKAKFEAGDLVCFAGHVSNLAGSGAIYGSSGYGTRKAFSRHENLIVLERSVRVRKSDKRPNRYMVTDAETTKKVGWFNEDDLELA